MLQLSMHIVGNLKFKITDCLNEIIKRCTFLKYEQMSRFDERNTLYQ